MEHRLIRGGEQYLPFARSCVAKLKKLGLPYADQSFEVDGVSIKVRIEPGHEYIRIEGSPGFLDMDSGIIDMGTYAVLGGSLPGTTYESAHAAAYNAAFTLKGTEQNWRTKPGSGGQITGRVTGGSGLRGAARVDGSLSRVFEPAKELVADSVPPVWQYRTEDVDLITKKVGRYLVPPSMFTGRCRMYVQAMYGRPRFEDSAAEGAATIGPSASGYTSLSVPGYTVDPVTNQRGGWELTTSSGVYFDPETGAHWLLTIAGPSLVIHPLISTKFGESQRRLLRNTSILSADDKEHLETHILSESYPRLESAMSVPIADVAVMNTMGFGWHWNWDGTCADIVKLGGHVQDTPDQEHYEMESTHLRLTLTPLPTEPEKTFAASVATIEGPVRWAVWRQLWCIVYPLHGSLKASKLTPKYSVLFDCDAPFYVFYTRNAIQVCRVKVTLVPCLDELSTSPGFGGATAGGTRGTSGGFYTGVDRNPTYYKVVFSVGATKLHEGVSGFYENWVYRTVSEKTRVGEQVLGGELLTGPLTITYRSLDGTLNTAYFPENLEEPYAWSHSNIRTQHTNYYYSTTETKSCQIVFAAAYNDAEAVYFGGAGATVMVGAERIHQVVESGSYWYAQTVDGTTYDDYRGDAMGTYSSLISTATIPATNETLDAWSEAYMVGKAGAVPASMEFWPMAHFYNDLVDDVPDPFFTLSGFRTDAPTILPRNKCVPSGANGHENINLAALVGWV